MDDLGRIFLSFEFDLWRWLCERTGKKSDDPDLSSGGLKRFTETYKELRLRPGG